MTQSCHLPDVLIEPLPDSLELVSRPSVTRDPAAGSDIPPIPAESAKNQRNNINPFKYHEV